jgi:hypothetical protein
LPNTLATVGSVMALLAEGGAECALFGGWAEEFLCLRPPGPHHDIDLVFGGSGFAAVERVLMRRPHQLSEVVAKRFAHKRAFLYDGVLCEVFLVQDADRAPFTLFWGDTRFDWLVPLLHDPPVQVDGGAIAIVSSANLRKYRTERPAIGPGRWADPESRLP